MHEGIVNIEAMAEKLVEWKNVDEAAVEHPKPLTTMDEFLAYDKGLKDSAKKLVSKCEFMCRIPHNCDEY